MDHRHLCKNLNYKPLEKKKTFCEFGIVKISYDRSTQTIKEKNDKLDFI